MIDYWQHGIYLRHDGDFSCKLIKEHLHLVIKHPFAECMHSFMLLLGGTYCKWQLLRDQKVVSEAEVVFLAPHFQVYVSK